ncbi:MAG: hypothetical protein ACJ8C4_02495 [Gemmataceae bacterium]
MKAQPRFLVAKYVPDIRRMEPRNIGVVVWSQGAVAAKFIHARDAYFVNDENTFLRWINYWKRLLETDELVVPRSDPKFLDALIGTQKENYRLYDAGVITDKVPRRAVGDAAAYLFGHFVTRPQGMAEPPQEQIKRLRSRSDQLLADTGISDREGFKRNAPVVCSIDSVQKKLSFSYALESENGLIALLQRVPVSQANSVYATLYMYERVQENRLIHRNNCVSIIDAPEPSTFAATDIDATIAILEKHSIVVNVADVNSAAARLVSATK